MSKTEEDALMVMTMTRATKHLYAIIKPFKDQKDTYRCIKLEADGVTPITSYDLSFKNKRAECPCWAGNKSTCRHRKMLAEFMQKKRVGAGWLYDFDNNRWLEPQEEE